MLVGASRGNLIGGVIGFTVGYFVEAFLKDELSIEPQAYFKEKEIKYTLFQKNLLALISEVVKADGYIHKEEIYFIKSFLLKQFGTQYSNMMLKTLKLNIDKHFDIKNVCVRLKDNIDYNTKIKVVTFLYGITIQDKMISQGEKLIVENIAKLLGIRIGDFEKIISSSSQKKKEYQKTSRRIKTDYSFDPYKVLGIGKTATDKEVKKAYRKMVLKYHPDKTVLSDEITNEKFSEISKAYHTIKKSRGIK